MLCINFSRDSPFKPILCCISPTSSASSSQLSNTSTNLAHFKIVIKLHSLSPRASYFPTFRRSNSPQDIVLLSFELLTFFIILDYIASFTITFTFGPYGIRVKQ